MDSFKSCPLERMIIKTNEKEDRRRRRKAQEEKEKEKARIRGYQSLSEAEKASFNEQIFFPGLIDNMFQKGYLPFFYNGCYGARGMSMEAAFLLQDLKIRCFLDEVDTTEFDFSLYLNDTNEIDSSLDEEDTAEPFHGSKIVLAEENENIIPEYEGCTIKASLIDPNIKAAKVLLYLGDNAKTCGSAPVFAFVKMILYNFIRISEYDGLENIYFDENSYKLT